MKRLTAILTAMVLCVAMVMPAYATVGYVDSVTAKSAPGIVAEGDVIGAILDENGNKVDDLLSSDIRITALADADTLPDEAKQELLDVFAAIENGTMDYPEWLTELLGDNVVVKDLFDVTAISDRLIAYLEDGHSIQFIMDVNLADGMLAAIGSYVGGEWVEAVEVVNNGDGTVTVTLSDLCPVAVFVEGEGGEPVGGDEPEEGCKVCNLFFPYLGSAPFVDGVCIICFSLIVLAVCAAGFVLYKVLKKGNKEN